MVSSTQSNQRLGMDNLIAIYRFKSKQEHKNYFFFFLDAFYENGY